MVVGLRLMQSASDLFLGWTEGREGRHFYVRQLHDMKIKLLVELFTLSVMVQYAEYCGWALARAHARAGQPSLIAGYLGKGDNAGVVPTFLGAAGFAFVLMIIVRVVPDSRRDLHRGVVTRALLAVREATFGRASDAV